ncbi:PROTEIN PHOSPHATASE 2C [Salix koriyanagi]|uniref:PROTEIN PHOSPHATASE 2C n=1 Tax=Salix koriyanagi TaxID=2511006 RepID=A0A9Q0VE46_9ROSI|nr:PROTEIN PHOSPHATASE 2C [Salix koriyanagi]
MKRWEEKLNLNLKEKMNCYSNGVNHCDVLRALSRALKKTEEAYFGTADEMAADNPELALMGSCVLAMLMKGEDVYLMNVGDSRAVLAQKGIAVPGSRKGIQDLEIIKEESKRDKIEGFDGDELYGLRNLNSIQLSMDHTTYVDKPKWNDILLEMFRIDYIGNSPYVTCTPSLYHHRLSPKDRFLILSSDGLYQYFTNQEAVMEVGSFIAAFPEADPAQHLIEEVLFRAAKNAGMDFHELLEIPQGERRRYHDDVSVIIISLEGRIWRSSV